MSRSNVSACPAAVDAITDSEPPWVVRVIATACSVGHATAPSTATFTIALVSSHHAIGLNMRLNPLTGFMRFMSSFRRFADGRPT